MRVLITGGTGFIGGALLTRLAKVRPDQVVLLVRPGTAKERYARFVSTGVQVVPVVMHDRTEIECLFARYVFDVVYHVAAIRGMRALSWEAYYASNVVATEYIAREAARRQCRLVYCSSVGVFGTIPLTLPATDQTPRQADNLYHRSKILAEERLRAMVADGLDVIVVRPTITYGVGDYGFPYSLVRLVDRGLYVGCASDVRVHMGDVETLVEAFMRAGEAKVPPGTTYVVGDREPVSLQVLVDDISRRLRGRPYPKWKKLPQPVFDLASFALGRVVRSDVWHTRLQLISQSWCYDVEPIQRELGLVLADTRERFGRVVDWYRTGPRTLRAWRSLS